MRFGIEHETTTLDNNGSTLKVTRKIHDYKIMGTTKRYEIRVKVRNEQQELEEQLRFKKELSDKGLAKTNTEFRTEHNRLGDEQGYYYVVKVWEEHQ